MPIRDPLLNTVLVADLRPTQITVGLHEVKQKRRAWNALGEDDRAIFLKRHMVPVLLGPKQRPYLTDHHHLARALLDEGCEQVLIEVIADLSMLGREAFWVFVDNRGWCHPYDDAGRRVGFDAIPKRVSDLVDDPFRSLAGALRRAGGFAKETVPFAEFLWADALRRRMKRKAVEADYDAAMEEAFGFAKSHDARYLPGWCGPSGDA